MDIDAASLWLATKSEVALKRAKELGINERVLNGQAKVAWKFIVEYHEKYSGMPSIGIIVENSGAVIKPPPEEERVSLEYVADKLYERHEYRSLQFGLGKAYEALENGDQSASRDEVLKLSDHLREDKKVQLQIHTLGQVAPEVLAMYERVKRGEIGVPFPWQTMTDITLGMWPGTLTFFVARPSVGKCVAEDTEIVDPVTGVPRSIREIYEGDVSRVTSWSKERGVHVQGISAKVDTGRKPCLRIVTGTGRGVIVTPEHPFLTPEGWVRADKLKAGMSVGIPASMPLPENPVRLDPEEVDLLALLLSEGTYSDHHVGFSTSDASILEIAGRVAEWANVDVTFRGRHDYDFVRRDLAKHPVRELLRKHGMSGPKAVEKSIPEAVFRLPIDQLARFISLFWMCDGYVSCGSNVDICLASEKMVRQIQSLLLRLGVQSDVAFKPATCNGKKFSSWRLRVISAYVPRFAEQMSFWGEKLNRLASMVAKVGSPNVGYPRVSDSFAQKLREISSTGSGRWRGGHHEIVASELGRTRFQTRDLFGNNNSLKMTAFKGFCRVYDLDQEHGWLWDSGLFWDVVESIEDVGERKIYDLTVSQTACFVANDIIVHNTWTAVILALHAWKEAGKKVLIVSPELGRVELGERLVSKYGEFAYGDIVSATLGSLAEGKLREVVDALHAGGGDNLFILDDEDKLSPEYIDQAVDAVEPELILIDSLYMLRVEKGKIKSGAGSKGDRMERVVETINWMRGMSRRKRSFAPTGLPVVGIHQLSREGKPRREAVQALKSGRGTGGLEDAVALSDALYWNAHNLFAMFQDPYMRQDKQLMYVPLKARRQAKISSLVVRWDLEKMDFREIGTKVSDGDEYKDDGDSVPY